MRRSVINPDLKRDRKNPKTGNWYIYWTEQGKGSRERSTRTKDRQQAEIEFAEWLLENNSPQQGTSPSHVLITDVLSIYLKRLERRSQLDKTKMSGYDRARYAAKPLASFWEGRFVDEISESSCEDFIIWRQRSNNTLLRDLGVLRSSVIHAAKNGYLTHPVEVFLPPDEEGRTRFLTFGEAKALLKAVRNRPKSAEHLELYLKIALLTGKRKEAILSLKWLDVDFNSDCIYWNPVGRRKTTKRRPTNKMPRRLKKYLLARREKYPDDEYVVTFQRKPIKDVRKGFAIAVKEAFPNNSEQEKVVPHTLRHTCATWLMQKGINPHIVAGFLGMSLETLMKRYGHHHPDFEKEAAEAF